MSAAVPASTPLVAPAVAPLPVDPNRCELHVWGSERFQSMTTGWLSGFGLVGGLIDSAVNADRDRLNRSQMGEALNTQGQTAALASLELGRLVDLPNHVVITHDTAIDPAVANRNRNRHAQSPSNCYAELIVTRLFYQKAALYGRSLRASFLFRDFGNRQEPHFTHAGRGGNGLSIFPAREEDQIDAANAEIVSVFRTNFEEYARNLARSRQRATRR